MAICEKVRIENKEKRVYRIMKKKLLGVAMLFSTLASAQFDLQLRETRFGVVAGPNYSRVRNAHNPSSARTSFFAGILALTPLDYDNEFYLQTQLEYLEAGERGGESGATYANNYISLPIYLKGYFSEAESEFFGFLGPRFGYLLSQKVDKPSRPIYNVDREGRVRKFDFAVSGGFGFSYKRKWEASFRYDWGFSNTLPDLKEENIADPNSKKNKPQHVVSVGLSHVF